MNTTVQSAQTRSLAVPNAGNRLYCIAEAASCSHIVIWPSIHLLVHLGCDACFPWMCQSPSFSECSDSNWPIVEALSTTICTDIMAKALHSLLCGPLWSILWCNSAYFMAIPSSPSHTMPDCGYYQGGKLEQWVRGEGEKVGAVAGSGQG